MTVPVQVYTTPMCPYCSNAKQLLQSKGANIHTDNDYALKQSSQNGHFEVVKCLLMAGANPEIEFLGGYSCV